MESQPQSTSIPSSTAARQRTLENNLRWLDRQTGALQVRGRRFSWYRLGAFLFGVILAGWGLSSRNPLLFFAALVVGVGIFSAVVTLHRRLDRRIALVTTLRAIRFSQLARIRLDWDYLPGAMLPGAMSFPAKPDGKIPAPCTSLALDLDLTGPRSLHHLVDQTVSIDGSRLLAAWLSLSEPTLDDTLARQAVVRELAGMPRFRDRLLLDFHLVSREHLRGEHLLNWLGVEYPAERLRWLLPAAAAFTLINAVLFVLNSLGAIPPYWAASVVLYAFFYYYNANLLGEFMESIVDLDSELDKFRRILHHLEKYPLEKHPELAKFCAPFRQPASLPSRQVRRIKWVTAGIGVRSNPVIGLMVNLILPWDFLFAWLAGKLRADASRTLPAWLEAWYRLDALISLGTYAYLNPDYTFPELSPEAQPVFETNCLGHPLVPPDRRVCNDFSIQSLGEVDIITGSNMAGKSTFVKAIGINLCLAYSGGPVCASSLRTVPFRLHTCIRISDSIVDGFSYFYAEVKCLKRLLDSLQADDPRPLLYLIDEIFRGTNNRERLTGSRAYVKTLLGARGAGLIATHDLELAGLAPHNPLIRNFHFRDRVEGGRLVFDYLIRTGPSPTTNALKIMELEGLPVDASPLPDSEPRGEGRHGQQQEDRQDG